MAPQAATTGLVTSIASPLADVCADYSMPVPVGFDEVDRVLGGGLAPGSVSLLAGEPGIGKSTLMLQIALAVASTGGTVVVVAGEEASTQVAARARRLGPIPPSLLVVEDTDVDAVVACLASEKPQLVVVDSIQTLRDATLDSESGSIRQVKGVVRRLVSEAKRLGISLVLVGHVTKEGSIAGPRVLEHLVDTVLAFDGERHAGLRSLRALKHRFGPTDEVGVFEMTGDGLEAVPDPSDRYLQDRKPDLAGSVVMPTLSGRRPVMVEVQGLVAPASGHGGSLSVQGVDAKRASLVAAVLASRSGFPILQHSVFVSSAGGVTVEEPAADLAMAMALVSASLDRPLPPEVVVCGELGLGAEVRSVPQLEHRLHESYRMGFRAAIVPASTVEAPAGMSLWHVQTLAEALDLHMMSPSAGVSSR